MIPEPSSVNVTGDILSPNDRAAKKFEDWEMGGVASQDPSQGLRFQEWKAYWEEATGDVYMTADNQPAPVLLYNEPGLVWLTLAFDQNMRWMSAYTVDNGQSYLKWYNSLLEGYETLALSSGVVTPFLTMDDNRDREVLLGKSDVILTYIRGGALYARVQRERFLTERLIAADIQGSTRIWHFGMNSKLRLQWELR
jgi:hypothetical protein